MELIRSLKKVLKENSYSRFWFRLGMAAFLLTPFLVYALHFDRTSEMDVFIATRFSGDTITDVYQVGMGRERYRRFEINWDDFHSYPIRVTDYGSDILIIKGASI